MVDGTIVRGTRLPELIPDCFDELYMSDCTADPAWFESETLLVNEVEE